MTDPTPALKRTFLSLGFKELTESFFLLCSSDLVSKGFEEDARLKQTKFFWGLKILGQLISSKPLKKFKWSDKQNHKLLKQQLKKSLTNAQPYKLLRLTKRTLI